VEHMRNMKWKQSSLSSTINGESALSTSYNGKDMDQSTIPGNLLTTFGMRRISYVNSRVQTSTSYLPFSFLSYHPYQGSLATKLILLCGVDRHPPFKFCYYLNTKFLLFVWYDMHGDVYGMAWHEKLGYYFVVGILFYLLSPFSDSKTSLFFTRGSCHMLPASTR